MAIKRLSAEYKQIINDPNYFYSVTQPESNFFVWNILLIGPPDSPFENALLECQLTFPPTYPNRPPEFKFLTKFPHPNVYTDGRICISILHEGKDEFEYEHISERWNPSHSVNSIMMSILSILAEPNLDSPANIDAKLEYDNFEEYKAKIYKIVSRSH